MSISSAFSGHGHPALHGAIASLGDAGRSIFGLLDGALASRRTLRELRALDDRTLLDIGLHRSEIESVAEFGRADWTRYVR